jgi:hypothetical protein
MEERCEERGRRDRDADTFDISRLTLRASLSDLEAGVDREAATGVFEWWPGVDLSLQPSDYETYFIRL